MYCTNCGSRTPPKARFCPDCGEALRGGSHSAVRLPESGAEAERRIVTVMFCDIVGSTALTASMDPEAFATVLLAYRELCAAIILRHGGHVARYVGDGILACFGYPHARGRDAQSAVTCGLAIAAEMPELNERLNAINAQRGVQPFLLRVRIGIESGVVVAGRLGPGAATEIDALIGTAPNDAAHLQHRAPPNGVVMGVATHAIVGDEFTSTPLPDGSALNLPNGFIVKAALRRGRGRVAPLVGRDRELAELGARWARTCGGHGQIVLVSGEPGIGKTRLLDEFLSRARVAPEQVLTMACAPQARLSPLLPALEALRNDVDRVRRAQDTPGSAADFVARLGLAADPYHGILSGALAGFDAGRASQEASPGTSDMTPAERRRALRELLIAWVASYARDRPAIVRIEDLQWADGSLLEFLRVLADTIGSLPILLVANYRNDFALAWTDRTNVQRITLPRLQAEEACTLVNHLMPQMSVGMREMILLRSEGVPFFLEEFALAAEAPALPPTLQQLLIARLDSLGEAKDLAQRAAVLGRSFDRDVLAAMCDLEPDAVEEGIRRMIDADIVVVGNERDATGFSFRHMLLQEAAYESMLHARRPALHRRAAEVLLRLRPEIRERHPEALARHFELGETPAEALPLLDRAAEIALSNNAHLEAENLLSRAAALARLLTGEARSSAELRVWLLRGYVLIETLGYASAAVQQAFDRAYEIAEGMRDQAGLLSLLPGIIGFYQVRGPLSVARRLVYRLLTLTREHGDALARADAHRRAGWCLFCMGEVDAARRHLTAAIRLAGQPAERNRAVVLSQDPFVTALSNLAWLVLHSEGPGKAKPIARAAEAAARKSGNAILQCYAFQLAGHVHAAAGDHAEAARLAEEVYGIATSRGIAYWTAMSSVSLGAEKVRIGDSEEGIALIEEGLDAYRRTQGELLRPHLLLTLARARLALGRHAEAAVAVLEGIEVARRVEAFQFLVPLQRLLESLDSSVMVPSEE
jgi:class 3 adenylate cyclase/tetratricopeptide (TPR) repeat protein